MSEHDDRVQDGTDPTYADGADGSYGSERPSGPHGPSTGSSVAPEGTGPAAATPAAYPPPAPYPPAGGEPSYGQAPAPQPYGGPVAPEQGQQPYAQQQPYGQQVPYGQGYGQSAAYTTTPQPYAYGPPPLSPEAEKVRSSAVLWTVLNGVAIFLCGNLLSIGGVVLAALAIGRTREDVPAARNLVRWSWILFAAGFAFWLLIIVGYVVFFIVLGTASMSGGF